MVTFVKGFWLEGGNFDVNEIYGRGTVNYFRQKRIVN